MSDADDQELEAEVRMLKIALATARATYEKLKTDYASLNDAFEAQREFIRKTLQAQEKVTPTREQTSAEIADEMAELFGMPYRVAKHLTSQVREAMTGQKSTTGPESEVDEMRADLLSFGEIRDLVLRTCAVQCLRNHDHMDGTCGYAALIMAPQRLKRAPGKS